MTRRADPYKSLPGESDAEYLKRIEPLERDRMAREAEQEAEWLRSPTALRFDLEQAETLDAVKAVVARMIDAMDPEK